MASVSDPFDVIQHQTYRIDAMDFMNFGCGYAALSYYLSGIPTRRTLLRLSYINVPADTNT
jgi:hypothetical protein